MNFAVKTVKLDRIKTQLLSLLGLKEKNIIIEQTNYRGIALLKLDERAPSTLSSIRNIEALLLDEVATAQLMESPAVSNGLSFRSLGDLDEREQYEHLSQLLHIQKATRNKR